MNTAPALMQSIAAALFALAIVHTFCTGLFERLAHAQPRHAGLWHWLGEVEVVFGFWAMVMMLAMLFIDGQERAAHYLESRNFTEPMFVFAVMVIAGSRPIVWAAGAAVRRLARALPISTTLSTCFLVLGVVPMLGAFITEPAAMTLAALMLRDLLPSTGKDASPGANRLRYALLGTLFVNISIGGALTSFAAPPVLMVAGAWNWDMAFMLTHFGGRAAIAVLANAALVTLVFRGALARAAASEPPADSGVAATPRVMVLAHIGFLAAVVLLAHHPAAFLGVFLFFMGFAHAYTRHQDPLILREALLVAFFLAGLVVLGGLQDWWLQPLLTRMNADTVFYGAMTLTAITDNAALTYLGTLVQGLSQDFKIALVAGALAGGGLTVIANAPNPAGVAILRERFADSSIQPLGLLLGALVPTAVAVLAFRLL